MSVTITKGSFHDDQEAIAEIESAGLYARAGAMGQGDLEDIHWHKTSLKIYVLEGSFETRDVKTDTNLLAGSGDIISIPAETLHAARCPIPATYVVGFESKEAAERFRPELPGDLPQRDS